MIIVTGATKGLGKAIAARLMDLGHEVLGIARGDATMPFATVAADVADYEALKAVAKKLRRDKKQVTGLINAAGIASMNLAVTTPPSITQKLIATNLIGTINACQVFAPLLMRSPSGAIINFSTIAVPLGLKGESVYVASKAGVEGFSKVFAREMADFNIRVNCIAPGPIETDLLKGVTDKQIDAITDRQVLQKRFAPDDVADLVEMLLDPRSQALSGQVLNVGGV